MQVWVSGSSSQLSQSFPIWLLNSHQAISASVISKSSLAGKGGTFLGSSGVSPMSFGVTVLVPNLATGFSTKVGGLLHRVLLLGFFSPALCLPTGVAFISITNEFFFTNLANSGHYRHVATPLICRQYCVARVTVLSPLCLHFYQKIWVGNWRTQITSGNPGRASN